MITFRPVGPVVIMAAHMPPAVRWAVLNAATLKARQRGSGGRWPFKVEAELLAFLDLDDARVVDQDFDRAIFNILNRL